MPKKLKTLLSIGGSDPTGGAGIQTDNRCAIFKGFHALNVITGVTAQNSKGVMKVSAVPSQVVTSQLKAILEEVMPDAVKIGMTATSDNVKAISSFLKKLPKKIPVVIDPVVWATAGGGLIAGSCKSNTKEVMLELYKNKLLLLASVITLNLDEAVFYSNNPFKIELKIKSNPLSVLPEIADDLKCNGIILKGGHSASDHIVDYLYIRRKASTLISEYSHTRINTNNLHGSGCAFASLMACNLVLYKDMNEAFFSTCNDIKQIISHSTGYVLGNSTYGPLNINNYKIN